MNPDTENLTELKPCPFCGEDAFIFHDTHSDYYTQWDWSVYCDNEVNCNAGVTNFNTKELAIKAWNTREGKT